MSSLIENVNPVAMLDGSTIPTAPNSESSTKIASTEFVKNKIEELGGVLKNPTGFPNFYSDSTLSINPSTRVVSLAPTGASFTYYQSGVKYVVSSTLTTTLTASEGFHAVYLNNGSLSSMEVFDDSLIKDYVIVGTYHYDSTNSAYILECEERHGLLDPLAHLYLHKSIGASYRSGFLLSGFSISGDGSSASHAQFTANSGSFADEDLDFTYTSTSQFPVFFRSGSGGNWRRKSADSFPLIYNGTAGYSGTRVPFNKDTSGTWSLQEAQEGYYICLHVFALNDRTQKIGVVVGTQEYSTLDAAKDGADSESTSLVGLPFVEFVPLGTVIIKTSSSYSNTPKATVQPADPSGANYLDRRTHISFNLTGAIGAVESHSLLSNLSADDHLQYFNITRGDARYQLKDTTLSGLASLDTTAGLVCQTATDTFTKRTLQGTTNRISISNPTGSGGDPTIDISASYIGQASITTVGTISTGTWNGTTIAISNGGTGQTSALAAFNALSPLTTKGDLLARDASNNARVAVGADNKSLVADSSASAGVSYKYNEALLNESNVMRINEDFIASTTAGSNAWTATVSGAAAAVALSTTVQTANRPGQISLTTGTTATGRASHKLGSSAFLLGGGTLTIESLIHIPTLATALQDYVLYVGLGDNTGAGDMVDGVYFVYRRSTSANWIYSASSNSTRTNTTSTTAVAAGSWIKLKIVVNAAASSVEFFVDGTSLGTPITTNIPNVAGRETGPIFKIEKTVGTTASLFYADTFDLSYEFTSAR